MRKTNRLAKRLLSLALALIMALGVCAAGVPGIIASALGAEKAADVTCGDLTFVVPEVIYLTPSTSTTSSFQYYVNNTSSGAADSTYGTIGKIYYTYSGASSATISYKFYNDSISSTLSGGSVTLSSSTVSSGSSVNITAGTSPDISTSGGGCYLEWKLSFTDSVDGKSKCAYAYSYIYRTYASPVGAASYVRDETAGHKDVELSIISWWTGVHGTTGTQPSYTDIGSPDNGSERKYPNTKADSATYYLNPLVEGVGISELNNTNASSWLNTTGGRGLDQTIRYNTFYKYNGGNKWVVTATTGDYAYIYVDSSRNTNLTQLPNYKFSSLLTDDKATSGNMNYIINKTSSYYNGGVNNDSKKHSVYDSSGDTSITSGSYGSTTEGYYYNDAYSVSIGQGSTSTIEFGIETAFEGKRDDGWLYKIGYVCAATYCPIKVYCTDKSSLRTAVQNAIKAMAKLGVNGATNGSLTSCYFDADTNYKWTALQTAYKAAVIELTKLNATDTSKATALNDALSALCTYYSVNGNGSTLSAAESGYVQVGTNQTASVTPAVTVNGRTGYTFGGWSTDANASSGSNTVTVGYNNTIYAVWIPNNYSVAFDGNGATGGSMSNQNFVYGTAQTLTANGFTKQYTVTYKNNNGTADTTDTANYTFANWLGSELLINDSTEYSYDNTSGGNYRDVKQWTISAPFAANEVYHLEFDAKGNGVTNFFYGASGYWQIATCVDGNGNTRTSSDGNMPHSLTNEYKHYSVTWTLKSSSETGANVNKYVLFRAQPGNTVTFKNVKFYKVTGAVSYSNGQSVNNLCSTSGAVYQMVAQWTPGSVTLPTPTYTNYAFKGWYRDSALTDAVTGTTFTPTENTTLYAKWIKPANDESYVIDNALSTKLNVLSNDADGATLKSVASGTGYTASVSGGQIVFKPTAALSAPVTFSYTVTFEGADYTANVTVIPATSVYYEEDINNITFTGNWTEATMDATLAANGVADVYGGMKAYDTATSAGYSNGKLKKTTVTSGSPAVTASFTFTGTGFDVYSLTDSTSGLIIIDMTGTVNGNTVTFPRTMLNTYFGFSYGPLYVDSDNAITLTPTDTKVYYTDSTGSGTFFIGEYTRRQISARGTTDPSIARIKNGEPEQASGWVQTNNDGLYQVPVLSKTGLDYGTYTVTITPKYSAMQAGGRSEYSFYFDSVRIYDPINPDSESAGNDVYKAANEYKPQYQTVRDILLTSAATDTSGIALVESKGETVSITDYEQIGPKNETYITPGQSIAFYITTADGVLPQKLCIGTRIAKGGSSGSISVNGNNVTVNGSSDIYRNITEYVDWKIENGVYTTTVPVVITNTSSEGVLVSVTKLKWSYNGTNGAKSAESRQLLFTFDEPALLACARIINAISAPVTYADSTGVTATWDKESAALGQTATLTIKANENFEKAFVDGAEVAGYSEQDGDRVWTYTFTPVQTGENAFDVTLLDINGYTTEPIATSIKAVAPTVSVSDAQISWKSQTVTLGDKAVLTITTPANIVKVTIGDTEITEYTETENGRQFIFETTPESAGVFRYSVILTETFGYSSANGTTPGITVKVPAADEPDTPENPENPENPDNPDNPGTDDEPEKELNFFEKLVKFFTELFAKVINIFKKAVN